jgi:imidazoleglycerol-phosphate dehydratase
MILTTIGNFRRATDEPDISIDVRINGTGESNVKTNTQFLDHLIEILATRGLMDVQVKAAGDLTHHMVEDVAKTLGRDMSKALRSKAGIAPFGWAIVPMYEALALALAYVDLGRRSHTSVTRNISKPSIENLSGKDLTQFLQSFATSMQACMHVKVQCGENDHHKAEAAFKALALSSRQACAIDIQRNGLYTSKGVI